MNAVRQKCRPKHQVLVLKCYPKFQKNVQEVKPNSSELSYLLYYASTRRSKLQKVGSFLEKKTASDVWRLKLGYVDDCDAPTSIDTLLMRAQRCPGHFANPHRPDGEGTPRSSSLFELPLGHFGNGSQVEGYQYDRRVTVYL